MNRMMTCAAAILILLAPAALQAKRSAPVDVVAVKVGDVEFTAPHSRMGCIEARDTKTGVTWWRQIYAVAIIPDLEGDVQHVFINSLAVNKDGTILIGNESGGQFKLDPQTMAVEVVKGSLIVRRK